MGCGTVALTCESVIVKFPSTEVYSTPREMSKQKPTTSSQERRVSQVGSHFRERPMLKIPYPSLEDVHCFPQLSNHLHLGGFLPLTNDTAMTSLLLKLTFPPGTGRRSAGELKALKKRKGAPFRKPTA
jgi:hypothetical protein